MNPRSLLLDGDPFARVTRSPDAEVVSCPCRCHDLWKMIRRGSV